MSQDQQKLKDLQFYYIMSRVIERKQIWQSTFPHIIRIIPHWVQKFQREYLTLQVPFLQGRYKFWSSVQLLLFFSQQSIVITKQQYRQLRGMYFNKFQKVIEQIDLRPSENRNDNFFNRIFGDDVQVYVQQLQFFKILYHSPYKRRLFWAFVMRYLRSIIKLLFRALRSDHKKSVAYIDANKFFQRMLRNFYLAKDRFGTKFWFSHTQSQMKDYQQYAAKVKGDWNQLMSALKILQQQAKLTRQDAQRVKKYMDKDQQKFNNRDKQESDKKLTFFQQQSDTQQLLFQQQYQDVIQQSLLQRPRILVQINQHQKKLKFSQSKKLFKKKVMQMGKQLLKQRDQIDQIQSRYRESRQARLLQFPQIQQIYTRNPHNYQSIALIWFRVKRALKKRQLTTLSAQQLTQFSTQVQAWLMQNKVGQLAFLTRNQFMQLFFRGRQYTIRQHQQTQRKLVNQYLTFLRNAVISFALFAQHRKKYTYAVNGLFQQPQQRQKALQQKRKRAKNRVKRVIRIKRIKRAIQQQQDRKIIQQYQNKLREQQQQSRQNIQMLDVPQSFSIAPIFQTTYWDQLRKQQQEQQQIRRQNQISRPVQFIPAPQPQQIGFAPQTFGGQRRSQYLQRVTKDPKKKITRKKKQQAPKPQPQPQPKSKKVKYKRVAQPVLQLINQPVSQAILQPIPQSQPVRKPFEPIPQELQKQVQFQPVDFGLDVQYQPLDQQQIRQIARQQGVQLTLQQQKQIQQQIIKQIDNQNKVKQAYRRIRKQRQQRRKRPRASGQVQQIQNIKAANKQAKKFKRIQKFQPKRHQLFKRKTAQYPLMVDKKLAIKIRNIYRKMKLSFRIHQIMMNKNYAYKSLFSDLVTYQNYLVNNEQIPIEQRQLLEMQIQNTVSLIRPIILAEIKNQQKYVISLANVANSQQQFQIFQPQQVAPLLIQIFPDTIRQIQQSNVMGLDPQHLQQQLNRIGLQAFLNHQFQQQRKRQQQIPITYQQVPLQIVQVLTQAQKQQMQKNNELKKQKQKLQVDKQIVQQIFQSLDQIFDQQLVGKQQKIQKRIEQIQEGKNQIRFNAQDRQKFQQQLIADALIPLDQYQKIIDESIKQVQLIDQGIINQVKDTQDRDFVVQQMVQDPAFKLKLVLQQKAALDQQRRLALEQKKKKQKQIKAKVPLTFQQYAEIFIKKPQDKQPQEIDQPQLRIKDFQFTDKQIHNQVSKIVHYQYHIHIQKTQLFRGSSARAFINPFNMFGNFYQLAKQLVKYTDMQKAIQYTMVSHVQNIQIQRDIYQRIGNVIFVSRKFDEPDTLMKLDINAQDIGKITASHHIVPHQQFAQQVNIDQGSYPQQQQKMQKQIKIQKFQIYRDMLRKITRGIFRLFQVIRFAYFVQPFFNPRYPQCFGKISQYKQPFYISYSVYTSPQYQEQKQINLWASCRYTITQISQIIKQQCFQQLQNISLLIFQVLKKKMIRNFNQFYQKYQDQINYPSVNVIKSSLSVRGKILPFRYQSKQFIQMSQNQNTVNLSQIYQIFKFKKIQFQKIPWKVMTDYPSIFQNYRRSSLLNPHRKIVQPSDCLADYQHYQSSPQAMQLFQSRIDKQYTYSCLGKFFMYMLDKKIINSQQLQQFTDLIVQCLTFKIVDILYTRKNISFLFVPFIQLSKINQQNTLCCAVTINHIYFVNPREVRKYMQVAQKVPHCIKYFHKAQKAKFYQQNDIDKLNNQRRLQRQKLIYQINRSQKFKTIEYSFRRRCIFVDIQCMAVFNAPQQPYLLAYVGYPNEIQSQQQKIYKGRQCIRQFISNICDFFIKYHYSPQDPLYIWSFNGNKYQMSYFKNFILQYFGYYRSYGGYSDAKFHAVMNGAVIFRDARTLMTTGSLKKLCLQFDSVYKKQELDIKLYDNQVQIDRDINQIAKYCRADCLALMSVLFKFWVSMLQVYQQMENKVITQNNVCRPFTISKIISVTTAASLAMQIFKTGYVKTPIQNNQPKQLLIHQSQSYFGGVTQVIRHISVGQLYPVDINSSYPKSMTFQLPWFYCGKASEDQVQLLNQKQIPVVDIYFYQITYFKYSQNVLPSCALIVNDKMYYPIIWKSQQKSIFVWGVTLKYMQQYGVRNIYKYTHVDLKSGQPIQYIADYTRSLYKFKQNQKSQNKKKCIKLLLNSLYGKFGQKQFDEITIYQKQTFSSILQSYLNMQTYRAENQLKAGQTYWQFQRQSKSKSSIGQFVRISSFIASSSRSFLSQASLVTGLDNIYYCDTDSLYLSKQGYESLQKSGLVHNKQLGKWKLQQKLKWALFISPKTAFGKYLDNQKFMIKWKGCPLEFVEQMLKRRYKEILEQFGRICYQLPVLNKVYPLQQALLISQRVQSKQGSVCFVRYKRKTNVNFKRYPNRDGSTTPCVIAQSALFPYIGVMKDVKKEQVKIEQQ